MIAASGSAQRAAQILLFALTIFVSAFLLFQVQPMVSKAILPWFGGGPAVWTAAMLFFQCALFGGYLYAHGLASLRSPRQQALIHLLLLAGAALLAASVLPDPALRPHGAHSPVAQILWVLTLSVGLPYFCLASTGPLLQHWYARTAVAGSVYRLFALSNLGSLLALLSFPYVFEPWLELPMIGKGWTWAFWAFALGCGAVALLQALAAPRTPKTDSAIASASAEEAPTAAPGLPPTRSNPIRRWREVAAWVLLPALASMMFIATTDQASHNVAPEPRLWIMTLSLYLITFIISFDHSRWYRPGLVAALALLLVLFTAGRRAIPDSLGLDIGYGVSELRYLFGAMLFLVCLVCHGELYRRRPADPSRLTGYYLWMSFGGACGGLFIALIATHAFDDFHEWPIGLAASAALCVLVLAREWRIDRTPSRSRSPVGRAAVVAVLLVCAGLAFWMDSPIRDRASSFPGVQQTVLDQSRNFYGVVAVVERRYPDNPQKDHRVFLSGQVTHGIQPLAPEFSRKHVSYYGPESGIGETLNYLKARRPAMEIGVTGLGAGVVAGYARPTDRYDFFEINPEAERIARRYFTFLDESAAAELRVLIGDARLTFAELPRDKKYDVILLAAFSGGSVPVHLLTREAFEAYARHLKPDGFLIVNITNAYLNLYPVVKRQADALGMKVRTRFQEKNMDQFIRENHYLIMTRDEEYLRMFPSVGRPMRDVQGRIIGTYEDDIPGIRLWTDSFSSITPLEWKD